jgi:CRISPR type IV-associated protein Csf3
MKHARKLTRNVRLSDIERVPIPLAKRTIAGKDVYCCSDPIYGETLAEWVDNQAKRFDTDAVALILHESQRKKLLTSSGPYKSRFVPLRVRMINKVCWFVRGDRKEINKLLKKIVALGHCRNIGYGVVGSWEYEELEEDNSIYAMHQGKRVVMKTLPIEAATDCYGYRHSYGGAFPPYWHPETFGEIAIPC